MTTTPNDAAVNAKNKVIATYPAVDDTNRYEEALFRYADRIEKGMPYLRNSTTDKFCTGIINDMREEAIKSIRNAQGSLGEAIAEDTKRRANAESANLVSDEMVERAGITFAAAKKWTTFDCEEDRIAMRAALESFAATLIERHATPQATHGEGEAEVEFPRFDGGKVVYDLLPAMKEGVIRDKLIAMGWTPPSPTAAPALGELAKALTEMADTFCVLRSGDQVQIGVMKFQDWANIARQAAAALSGVAAQGDDHV